MAQLPPYQRIRLVINGVFVPTSVIRLRRGSCSSMIQQLLIDFESTRRMYLAEGRTAPTGYATTYYDADDRPHSLQIDLE